MRLIDVADHLVMILVSNDMELRFKPKRGEVVTKPRKMPSPGSTREEADNFAIDQAAAALFEEVSMQPFPRVDGDTEECDDWSHEHIMTTSQYHMRKFHE
jgi:hypothetical protein